jgi:hypothetical protein
MVEPSGGANHGDRRLCAKGRCAEVARPRVGVLLFLVPTTLLFHGDASSAPERIQLLKNLAILGGLLLVLDQPSPA